MPIEHAVKRLAARDQVELARVSSGLKSLVLAITNSLSVVGLPQKMSPEIDHQLTQPLFHLRIRSTKASIHLSKCGEGVLGQC